MRIKCYGPHCYSQGIKHNKADLIMYKRRNYCSLCFPIVKSEKEAYQHLLTFIKNNYHIQFPTQIMLNQIKQYRQIKGYSSSGIEVALEYMHLVKGKAYNSRFGLGYIPYIYEEAQIWKVKTEQKTIINSHVEQEPETVFVDLENRSRPLGLLSEEDIFD